MSKEDEVMESALNIMKKSQQPEDCFETFGKHVANELGSLNSELSQQWAKFKINEIIFQAQCSPVTHYQNPQPNLSVFSGRSGGIPSQTPLGITPLSLPEQYSPINSPPPGNKQYNFSS